MRSLFLLSLLVLSGCALTEAIGFYNCDSYCEGISDRVEECAQDQGVTWEDLAGGDKTSVLAECQDQIDARQLSDVQCAAETVTINNADCETIIDTVADYL